MIESNEEIDKILKR